MSKIFILLGIVILISIILLFTSKHVGRAIIYTILPISIIFLILIFKPKGILQNIILYFFLTIIIISYIFIQRNITYDFMNKIYTYRYFINSIILKPRLKNNNNNNNNNNYNNNNSFNNDNVIIGKVIPYNNYQLKYNGKYITMNDISAAGATMISGSIGSGKTYSLVDQTKQNIIHGQSIIFCDYKGDPDTANQISSFAEKFGYKICTLAQGKSDFSYDPLQNLNNVGRIEAIMNMRKWDINGSDDHYRTGTQLLLQKTIGEFSHYYRENSNGVDNTKSYTYEYYKYMKRYNPSKKEWDSYDTTLKLLELSFTSSLEPMFLGQNEKILNLKELKNEKFLLIVSFVSSNKDLATSFSSLLFRDLLDECTVEPPMKNINLKIDEFATLNNPFIIKDILEKGRSGKIATTLAVQDINQVIIQTNEAYLNSLLGIVNTFIVFSGVTRNTAEKFAGVQLHDIETILMNLRKPINGKPPTAIYISKYPSINKRTNSEVFRFEPYGIKDSKFIKKQNNNNFKIESSRNNSNNNYNSDNNLLKSENDNNKNYNLDNEIESNKTIKLNNKNEYNSQDNDNNNSKEIKVIDNEEMNNIFNDLI